MPFPSADWRSTVPRVTLRASLLGGALLDATVIVAMSAVSYPSLMAPALALRAILQGLSCYDLHRYAQAIPWIAVSLAIGGLGAELQEAGRIPGAQLYAILGLAQWVSWRMVRS